MSLWFRLKEDLEFDRNFRRGLWWNRRITRIRRGTPFQIFGSQVSPMFIRGSSEGVNVTLDMLETPARCMKASGGENDLDGRCDIFCANTRTFFFFPPLAPRSSCCPCRREEERRMVIARIEPIKFCLICGQKLEQMEEVRKYYHPKTNEEFEVVRKYFYDYVGAEELAREIQEEFVEEYSRAPHCVTVCIVDPVAMTITCSSPASSADWSETQDCFKGFKIVRVP